MTSINYTIDRQRSGYKYRLLDTYVHRTQIRGRAGGNDFLWLYADGTIVIRTGYAWDGASGPAIDTVTFMRGSLVHDALYQLIREGVLTMDERIYADNELRATVLEDGMWPVRAWWVYYGVRIFGPFYMTRGNK